MKYIFPCLLLIAAISCKRPGEETSISISSLIENTEPIIFYTSLSDSISAKALESIQLGNVTGIKIKYLSGYESRYFEYDADKKLVIRVISQLPFAPFSKYSDSLCRKISYEDLTTIRQSIPATEYESSSFFWNADLRNIELYECIKSPFKHTLLIDLKSNHVMHRIEVIG